MSLSIHSFMLLILFVLYYSIAYPAYEGGRVKGFKLLNAALLGY